MKRTTLTLGMVLLGMGLFGFLRADSPEQRMDKGMEMGGQKIATAVFAGGCFWCTESDFEKVPGVISVVSGYTGGSVVRPTYKQVSAGKTGHVESVKVSYDPAVVSYEKLLDTFWRHVDPTDSGGQFVDRGSQYRSVIYYADDGQRAQAEKSKKELAASGPFKKDLVTEILPLGTFYPAETYHQDYYKKNPLRYKFYRYRSGRDQFLKKVWGDEDAAMTSQAGDEDRKSMMDEAMGGATYEVPGKAELRSTLTPLQYDVTQQDGTEPPFKNAYWDNHEEGIYVDIVSGEPLFSSKDKFASGTGWPSFTRPLVSGNIVEKRDRGFFSVRTEVRSKHANSHLGHVFADGPQPTGLRYCINSAALRFVPKSKLAAEGYAEYAGLFE